MLSMYEVFKYGLLAGEKTASAECEFESGTTLEKLSDHDIQTEHTKSIDMTKFAAFKRGYEYGHVEAAKEAYYINGVFVTRFTTEMLHTSWSSFNNKHGNKY